MKTNYPYMVMESNFKNDHYTYLKYSDNRSGLSTMLFFMSDKDRCTSVKLIYDLSLAGRVVDELDRLYKKTSDTSWVDNSKRAMAIIRFEEEDWFVSVSIKPGN